MKFRKEIAGGNDKTTVNDFRPKLRQIIVIMVRTNKVRIPLLRSSSICPVIGSSVEVIRGLSRLYYVVLHRQYINCV
ncbi:MAG: hypothetical protein WCE91_07255 [Nitrososphaeraceae archaeon]